MKRVEQISKFHSHHPFSPRVTTLKVGLGGPGGRWCNRDECLDVIGTEAGVVRLNITGLGAWIESQTPPCAGGVSLLDPGITGVLVRLAYA